MWQVLHLLCCRDDILFISSGRSECEKKRSTELVYKRRLCIYPFSFIVVFFFRCCCTSQTLKCNMKCGALCTLSLCLVVCTHWNIGSHSFPHTFHVKKLKRVNFGFISCSLKCDVRVCVSQGNLDPNKSQHHLRRWTGNRMKWIELRRNASL